MLNTAIIFVIFRRPDVTARVFQAIRAARPCRLVVVADGPRLGHRGESEMCAAARAACHIDWPCELLTSYSDSNLGLRARVVSGITWAFTQVDRAIVLEDDCWPHPSFFEYCQVLLERFADDDRVMAISGDNFQPRDVAAGQSYYFSRYPHCWGWATWRRAWQLYDDNMSDWICLRDSGWLEEYLQSRSAAVYWRNLFDATYRGDIDSWAYRWTLSCWRHGGLTALPHSNLVTNIGFGADATHTSKSGAHLSRPTTALDFPLRHPPRVAPNELADKYTQRFVFGDSIAQRTVRLVRGLASRFRSIAR